MPIDYGNYNPAWPFLRELISHREGNKCKRCRAPHRVKIWRMKDRSWRRYGGEEAIPGARKLIMCICSVAHLDWDRTNDAPENLALLCQQCHLDHDRPQHLHWKMRAKLDRSGQRELFAAKPPRPAKL